MSGEFDGLDATEKAGFEAALNRCGRLALKLRANSVTRGPSISLTSWRWQTFVPSLSTFETGLRDLFGGAISGVISIVYCVSYAAFIFSGPLAPWLGYGIAATFISTTIGALYRVPEILTLGRFPDARESDSTWRTQEVRHVGSDTIAPRLWCVPAAWFGEEDERRPSGPSASGARRNL